MLHEVLATCLKKVEQAILQCRNVYVERYVEEIFTSKRMNLRVRLRFERGHLLEINEAVRGTSTMRNDPIVTKVRAIRNELAAQCGYDIKEIFRSVQEQQAKSGLKSVRCPARPVAPAEICKPQTQIETTGDRSDTIESMRPIPSSYRLEPRFSAVVTNQFSPPARD